LATLSIPISSEGAESGQTSLENFPNQGVNIFANITAGGDVYLKLASDVGTKEEKMSLLSSLTSLNLSMIHLIVVDNKQIPVSAQEFYAKVVDAIDEALVNCEDLPKVKCSKVNNNIKIDVEEERAISFVRDALFGLNLSVVRFNLSLSDVKLPVAMSNAKYSRISI